MWISLASGLAVGGLLYLLAPWLADNLYHKPALGPIFRLFAVALPFVGVLTVTAAITRSTQDMRYTVLVEDVGQPLLGLMLMVGIYLAAGRWLAGVILSDLFSFFIAALAGMVVVRRLFSNLLRVAGQGTAAMGEVLAFSVPTALAGTFAVFVFWLDRLMVGFLLPAYDNGLYQAASQVSAFFVLILAAFNAILSPLFAQLHSRGDLPAMQEVYRVGIKWSLYGGLPVFLVICIAPQAVLAVLYGRAYAPAWLALIILSVGQIVNLATGSVGTLLSMSGYQRAWLNLSAAALALNFLLCLFLIPRLGIPGAAIATSVSLSVMYVSGILYVRTALRIWPYDTRTLKVLAASASSGLALVLLRGLLYAPTIWFLLLAAIVAAGVFFGVLFLLGFDPEDHQLFALLRLTRSDRSPAIEGEGKAGGR
jgi:O-antigen/teichoic acid export membrane protein